MRVNLKTTDTQPSLRRELLIGIIAPMLLIILIDTTILYSAANHFIEKSFDDGLLDTANDISELIKVSKVPVNQFQLGREAHEAIMSDTLDKIYYSIYDQSYKYLTGDRSLLLTEDMPLLKDRKVYSESIIQDNFVRVVTIATTVNNDEYNKIIYVQVAETLNKRNALAKQILVGIILPQLLLLIAAAIMFSFGIKRGLSPLNELNNAILKKSLRELSPIQISKVPKEVSGLVESINVLINQLKSAVELQNRFIADAAHQLKTPLAGIQAQLELAVLEADKMQSQSSLYKVLLNTEKLSHMISQLLKLAQNQPETFNPLKMKVVNLGEISRKICINMVPVAYKKNIDLGLEMTNEYMTDLEIMGDYNRLTVMLENLVDNSIRYTPANGKVTVNVYKIPDKVILSIEDTGVGIDEAERKSVFERFHRVIDNQQEGSGLGLAIVKEIVQLHDAEINIETPKSGIGTRFTIIFPSLMNKYDYQ